MRDEAQISAAISVATKERLDHYVEQHGLKKNFIVEQALLFYLEARRELPDEAFIPTRLLVQDGHFDALTQRLSEEEQPSAALQELMRG